MSSSGAQASLIELDRAESEWRLGWRIVMASAFANATGVALYFYTFSMFLLPIGTELHLSRGDLGLVQSLVAAAALGSILIGRIVDRVGFRFVYISCTLTLAAAELAQAKLVHSFGALALTTALIAFVGGGSLTVLVTRPINAHFKRNRGLALGLVGVGASIATVAVPPILESIIASSGWRDGMQVLAGLAFFVGMPLVLLLMPAIHARRPDAVAQPAGPADRSYMKERDFWLLVAASVLTNVILAGSISQLSPMLQEQGLSAKAAAYGLSAFAIGQFIGKVSGGFLLDTRDPRLVAAAIHLIPTIGFATLLSLPVSTILPIVSVGLIGLLQGADIGIFAYFAGRRFDIRMYGTIYGVINGLGWIGAAIGAIGFGYGYELFGSYGPDQAVSIALLLVVATLFLPIHLPPSSDAAG